MVDLVLVRRIAWRAAGRPTYGPTVTSNGVLVHSVHCPTIGPNTPTFRCCGPLAAAKYGVRRAARGLARGERSRCRCSVTSRSGRGGAPRSSCGSGRSVEPDAQQPARRPHQHAAARSGSVPQPDAARDARVRGQRAAAARSRAAALFCSRGRRGACRERGAHVHGAPCMQDPAGARGGHRWPDRGRAAGRRPEQQQNAATS